jgi:hypothetical protein
MGIPQAPGNLGDPGPSRGRGRHPLSTAGAYLLLFVLGAAEGLFGSFHYGGSPVPFIAILLDLIVFATCLLAGLGLGSYGGGIFPALGWIVASFIFAMPRSNGSVIITANSAGEWYLYGGALAAVVGAIASFYLWTRARLRQASDA